MNSASYDKSNNHQLRGANKGHKPPVSAGAMTPAGAKGSKDNPANNSKIFNTSLSE
jgi:hypothetical protein